MAGVCYALNMQRAQRGLTFIEILLVIGIFAILAGLVLATVTSSRHKAIANRIRGHVGQIRILAEIAFDSNGGSYVDWSQEPSVQAEINRLLDLIDEDTGDAPGAPHTTLVRESQAQNYCVSAPLGENADTYYCVDATGKFREVTSACPDHGDDLSGDPPLRCPGN